MNKRYNPTMRTAINQFCWEWFDEVKGHLMQLVGEDEETPFSYTKVFGLFAGAYVNKLPEASLNFEVLDRAPYDEDNYDLFIRDYPFGEHWYLHMGLQALWSDDTNDQVITHLDGHVAASCTSLHAFTVPVPVVRKWFIAATNQYFYYDTKTGLGGISAQQVCRLLLDKITFWDGAYQTSHVKLTNCVAGPRYWHSKEDYIEEYSVTMNEYDEPYVLLPEAYVFFGAMNLIITAATQGGDYLVPEDQTPRLNYCQNPAFLRC